MEAVIKATPYRLVNWGGHHTGITLGKVYNIGFTELGDYSFIDDLGTPRMAQIGDWDEYNEESEVKVNVAPQRSTVVPEVMKDLTDRMAIGVKSYGEPLSTFNGRDAMQDLYEELLDAACYIKQFMMERDNK